MALTEAQKRAKQKYREKNRERTNYLNARTTARSFIKNKATKDDLEELEELIKERKNMCKYCDKSTEDNPVKSIYYDDLDVYIIGNELNIDLDMNVEDIYVDNRYEIEINYCPMCGRKL